MSLAISRMDYRDFRTYGKFTLDGLGGLTLIVGPNAVGKTNLIEGIQLVTAMTSFRTSKADHFVRNGAASCSVKATATDGNRLIELELRVIDGSKAYFLNGKKKRAHELRGTVPSVTFCPDDLELAKGGQAVRRSWLDQMGSQLSPNYHAVRKDYEKILRQKNRCLKDELPTAYLSSINEVLASVGAQLYRLRSQMMTSLVPYIQTAYRDLAGGIEEVSVAYVPSWERKEHDLERCPDLVPVAKDEAAAALIASMERRAEDERVRHLSLVGPQLDRVEFYLDGLNTTSFASQGQQRSLVLACKMAEVALIRDRLAQAPVLLLDDVMSELDEERRRALFGLIADDVQTFITATNAESFEGILPADARIVRLGEGDDAL